MTEITVHPPEGSVYAVTVADARSSVTYQVTVAPDTLRGSADVTPERVIEASFRFLLDREPKESILRRFALTDIARYFPDYPDRLGDYL